MKKTKNPPFFRRHKNLALFISLFLVTFILVFIFGTDTYIVLKGDKGDSKFIGKSGGDAKSLYVKLSNDKVFLHLELYEPNNYDLKYYIHLQYRKENADILDYSLIFTPLDELDEITNTPRVSADFLLQRVPFDYDIERGDKFPPVEILDYNKVLKEHKDYIYAGYQSDELYAAIPVEVFNLPEGYDLSKPYAAFLQIEDFRAQLPENDYQQLSPSFLTRLFFPSLRVN